MTGFSLQPNGRSHKMGSSGFAPIRSLTRRATKGADWSQGSWVHSLELGMERKHADVVQLRVWRERAQAFKAALMCGANARTVAIPGDLVSPDATLRSVWNGMPESTASLCSCGAARGDNAARTSSGLGTDSFMEGEHTDPGTSCLPFSVQTGAYPTAMPGDQAKAVVIENVKLLMTTKYGKINITAFGRDTGISNGGTQRVLDPDTSVGVDLLARIADHFKIEIWQLLAPNLGQALKLSPAELEAVRKIREPQQPKVLGDRAKQDQPFNLNAGAPAKKGRRREA
jgi:hypothetical protein